jgi:hypothetical protein
MRINILDITPIRPIYMHTANLLTIFAQFIHAPMNKGIIRSRPNYGSLSRSILHVSLNWTTLRMISVHHPTHALWMLPLFLATLPHLTLCHHLLMLIDLIKVRLHIVQSIDPERRLSIILPVLSGSAGPSRTPLGLRFLLSLVCSRRRVFLFRQYFQSLLRTHSLRL